MFGLSEAGGTKRCTVCKSINLRTNAQKALICCDCLTVVEERRIYTDDFKEYKNPKVSKKRDYLQEKVKNKGDEQFESFRDHLHKNWVFYLHVFQKHLRRISNFLSRAYGVPKLEETTKDLWIAYLSKWREKAYPLVSKFTFSNPGHFEVRPRAGMRKGETISSIPQRIVSKLEEQDEEIDLKIERKKSMNYDMIFGDLEGTKGSKNKGGGFLGLQSQEEILGLVQADEKPFLDSIALNAARRYHLRSKRRFLSSRKSVSKKSAQNALGMGRRRKSSLTTPNNPNSAGRKSTLTEAEQDKLRALEELENSARGCTDKSAFWNVLRSHYDQLCRSVEPEYVVRLYVEYLIARPGKFSQLSDWTKVRDEKHLICGKVCDYLVQNLYLDDPEEFLTAMNVKYLEDFKPVFYSALFMIELIKLWQQIRRKNSQEFKERSAEKSSSVEFPCTIPQMIELSNECVMYPELRSKLHADIGRLEETIQLVISDYRTQTGTTNISASQLLNATQEPMFAPQFSLEGEDVVDENTDTGNLNPSKHIYPLDDNLLFVLPFVALKLCGKALSSKDYIQLLSEHPQESLCQNILTEYEDLVDQLYPQFMSYKLSLQAPTLNLYQFRLVEFVFEDFQKLHTHFPQYYDPDDGAPQDESLLYPAGMYFRLLKKVWKDLTLPDTLLPIASNLLCGLVVANPEYVSQREELMCLGIAYFLLKAFYGLGLNFPSLTTIARGVAEAELVQDQEGVASFNRCLDFIEKFSSEHPDALVALSKRLPSFGSVVDIWCKTYELIKRKGDSASFYPQTVEDMAALTYPQMITLIEKTAPQLLHSTKKPRVKFLEKPKSKDRLSVTRKNPSTTTHIQVSYPSRPGAYVVKEEVKDEMAFILDCTTLDDSELDSVQLPLPADVFVKFKQLGSQPVSSIPEDVLIVFEVFTAWAGMDKERVMQTLEGTEKQILKLLG